MRSVSVLYQTECFMELKAFLIWKIKMTIIQR